MKVELYKSDGKIETIDAENSYHAQNILVMSFLVLDEDMKNDVVFGRLIPLDTSDMEHYDIFAYRKDKEIVMRNATKEFIDSQKALPKCDKCGAEMKVADIRDDGCRYFECRVCGSTMGEETEEWFEKQNEVV